MAETRFHRVTGSGALSTTLAPGVPWQLESIRLHLSAVGGVGGGSLTATLDHGAGSEYDIEILSEDLESLSDYIYHTERPMEFGKDDELDIAWDNSNSVTYGLEVVWKGLGV